MMFHQMNWNGLPIFKKMRRKDRRGQILGKGDFASIPAGMPHGYLSLSLVNYFLPDLVRANFPEALLLARAPVAWGATREVLTPENLLKARQMCEAFDTRAEACRADAA